MTTIASLHWQSELLQVVENESLVKAFYRLQYLHTIRAQRKRLFDKLPYLRMIPEQNTGERFFALKLTVRDVSRNLGLTLINNGQRTSGFIVRLLDLMVATSLVIYRLFKRKHLPFIWKALKLLG